MGALVSQIKFVPPEEPQRHRFTLADVLAIQDAGFLGHGRTELIDGDIIDLQIDTPLDVRWIAATLTWIMQSTDHDRFWVLPRSTLRLSAYDAPSPDLQVHPWTVDVADAGGGTALFIMELADVTLHRDLNDRAHLYARHGVRDYWVIDLEQRRLHVHREPGPDGYASVEVFERDQPVAAMLISGLTLRLADLPRVG